MMAKPNKLKPKDQLPGEGQRSSEGDFNLLTTMLWFVVCFVIHCILCVIAIFFGGRTDHLVNKNDVEDDEDDSLSYKIPCTAYPDDQGSTVTQNLSRKLLRSNHHQESESSCLTTDNSFTQESQHMISVNTFSTSNEASSSQEQSTMMDYKEEPTCSSDVTTTEDEGTACITESIIQADVPFEEVKSDVQDEEGDVTGDVPEVVMASLVDSAVGETFDVEANGAIPDDQGSAVTKNLNKVDMTLVSSNHLQESELSYPTFETSESQDMIRVDYTLSTSNKASNLQEQLTMMDYKEEPTCSVITTEDEEAAHTTEDIVQVDVPSSVFEKVKSVVQDEEDDVTGDVPEVAMASLVDSGVGETFDVETNEDIPDDQGSAVTKNLSKVDMTLLSSNHLEESKFSCPTTDNSFTQEMINVDYTLSTSNEASNLQEQSTMMDYTEEPTCSSDAVTTAEHEETTRTTEDIVQADVPSSVFDEVISDVQDDVTGDVPEVAMASLVDSEVGGTVDVEANEAIPDGQDLAVTKNLSKVDMTLLSSNHLQESELSCPTADNSFTQKSQHVISVHYTLSTSNKASNLQEQLTMMDYKEEPTCSVITTEDEEAITEDIVQVDVPSSVFEKVKSVVQDEEDGVTGDVPEVAMASLVESGVGGTFDVETNGAIPDDQGSAVTKNLSKVDTTLLSSYHLQEYELSCPTTDNSYTQESQQMINVDYTLSNEASNLQEQSTMMDYTEEPTCSSDAVTTAEDEETTHTTEDFVQADVPSSVFDEVKSDVQDDVTGDVPEVVMASLVDSGVGGTFDVEANGAVPDGQDLAVTKNLNGAIPDGQDLAVTKNLNKVDMTLVSSNHLQEYELSYPTTDNSFTQESQHMISVDYSLSTSNETFNLQEQSTMMDYKEEPTCSNDVVIATEDEETACTTKYIVQADVPLSVFDEMISDVQDDVTGDVPKVAMASLVDYGMNATFDVEANGDDTDLIGYCNQFNGNGFDENITQYESMAEFETFYGQALFKAGKAEESIIHFKKGVGYLGINIPSTKVGSAFNLAYQAVKHFLHAKTSKLFQKKKQYQHLDGVQCERAHCMGQLTKVYHHQQQNLLALMSSYQQLNAAEKCGDLYELMEAYASVIDCCQSYSLDNLSEHYVKKANKKSSEINLDDSTATLHLLRSTMMFELCHGEIVVAGQKGKTAKSIAGKHNASLLLTTSIEYLSTELLMLNTPAIKECLDQMCDIPKDLEDHDRITALITCGNFDVFLEIGMKPDDFEGMIEAAKRYSIQKFPTGEDFYLATCLATWYARIRQWRLAMKYITIANSKTPTSYNFAMTKALCRQAECLLLLDNSLDDKTISKLASKTMKKLKKKIKTCRVFGPRYMMLRSYQLLGEKKYSKAQDMLLDSITGAKRMFNYCDASWAELNKLNWFPGRKEPSIMQQQQFSFFSFP